MRRAIILAALALIGAELERRHVAALIVRHGDASVAAYYAHPIL